MQLWNMECELINDGEKRKGQLVIFTDRVIIQLEKTKLFGLIFDGYHNYSIIQPDNIIKIESKKITGNNTIITIITSTNSVILEFNTDGMDPAKEIMDHLKISKKLSKRSKFSMDRVVKEYYREVRGVSA